MWQQMLIDIFFVFTPFSLIDVNFMSIFRADLSNLLIPDSVGFYGMSSESINSFRLKITSVNNADF